MNHIELKTTNPTELAQLKCLSALCRTHIMFREISEKSYIRIVPETVISDIMCVWGQSPFTLCRPNLNLKILSEILVSHTQGGQSSLTMCRLNLNSKILGEILVGHNGEGFNHLSPCAGQI